MRALVRIQPARRGKKDKNQEDGQGQVPGMQRAVEDPIVEMPELSARVRPAGGEIPAGIKKGGSIMRKQNQPRKR
jgi:hypothetical protein